MIDLNVNVDHVATIREARGGEEPEPVTAALKAELAGANGIVCHLREDRRHINDRDFILLRELVGTKLDLEMAAVEEIIEIALQVHPDLVTIVPEKRQELTTEGGLDAAGNKDNLKSLAERMHGENIEVSLFIEPTKKQINAALDIGADMTEFHTGLYANAENEAKREKELKKLSDAIAFAKENNLKIAAGHGLNYQNVKPVAQIKGINELSIGHSIISKAVLVGIEQAVRDMKELIYSAELISR